MWRVAQMSVLDVASGIVTKIHDTLPQPGTPTWSPDGKRIALAWSRRYTTALSRRNQPGVDLARPQAATKWYAPCAHAVDRLARRLRARVVARRHEDGRDLRRRVVGVAGLAPQASRSGRRAVSPPKCAHSPSWAGDSKQHSLPIVGQAADRRRRNRRHTDGAAGSEIHARRPNQPPRRCTPAGWWT